MKKLEIPAEAETDRRTEIDAARQAEGDLPVVGHAQVATDGAAATDGAGGPTTAAPDVRDTRGGASPTNSSIR